MQWLVGLDTGALQMTVRDANASHVTACCPCPPLDTMSALRKRLLVLFAGNTATRQRWPNSNNDWGDWQDVLRAIQDYFRRPDGIKWCVADGRMLRDAKANAVMQEAMSKCAEILAHPQIQAATIRLATAFAAVPPCEDGVTRIDGREAVLICEAVIGEGFRAANSWSRWIAGE